VLAALTTMGDSVFVRWGEVPGAATIEIQLAYDAEFTKPSGFVAVDGERTWATLTDLPPETTFFIRLIAIGDGTNNSVYSNVRSIRTLPEGMAGTNDEIATNLQTWLDALRAVNDQYFTSLPQVVALNLTPAERRRLLGSGVRRYGFIDKVSDVAEEYPQFWPASIHGEGDLADFQDKLKGRLREIEVLRNVLVYLQTTAREAGDLLLLAGNDAFRLAGAYYTSVRAAAGSNQSGAAHLYELLKLFWNKRRSKSSSEEPTIPEVLRDASGLLRGRKDGTVRITHESPTLLGGRHEVVDDVHR